jgi:hypothetical protein
MDFKCDELILGKKDADSRALTIRLQQMGVCLPLHDLPFQFWLHPNKHHQAG